MPSTGLKIHAGYTTSGNFTLNDASTGHIVGPEFGLEIPVQKVAGGFSLNLYPSVLLGTSHSAGPQGNVYRILLSAREAIPGSKIYTYYALGVGSRFKDSYWLSEGFPDEKLEKQFRLRRIDLGQEFSGMVLPKDISQSDAKAFFRADLNLMLSGSAPDLIRRNTDSEIASRVAAAARIVGGTEDCRKAAKAWRRQD